MTKLKLINDKYRKARGGYSRFLNIYCEKCNQLLALYQKDGPGPLRRTYVDRIREPKITAGKGNFSCPKCKKVIGTFFIYDKENRLAIRLYQDSVIKKIKKFPFRLEIGLILYIKKQALDIQIESMITSYQLKPLIRVPR